MCAQILLCLSMVLDYYDINEEARFKFGDLSRSAKEKLDKEIDFARRHMEPILGYASEFSSEMEDSSFNPAMEAFLDWLKSSNHGIGAWHNTKALAYMIATKHPLLTENKLTQTEQRFLLDVSISHQIKEEQEDGQTEGLKAVYGLEHNPLEIEVGKQPSEHLVKLQQRLRERVAPSGSPEMQ